MPANIASRYRSWSLALARSVAAVRSTIGWVWTLLSLAVFIPLAGISLLWDRRQRLHDFFSVVWARGILGISGVRYSYTGRELLGTGERFVIVSNHQSILDIPTLLSVVQPVHSVRFVAKRSLFRVPILGWGMRIFGHMPVDPKSMRASYRGLQQAQQSVEGAQIGHSVIIFPEATRSDTGRIKTFHTSAFHIAARAGIRILPITISGGISALARGGFVVTPGAIVNVQIHPPITVQGTTIEAIQNVTRECQALIAQALPADQRGE